MTPEMFVELFRDALWMVLIMVCAIIIPESFDWFGRGDFPSRDFDQRTDTELFTSFGGDITRT